MIGARDPRERDPRKHEVWRPVVGLEARYEVSSFGRVRTLDVVLVDAMGRRRHHRAHMKKASRLSTGYLAVTLCGKTYLVHGLVTRAFLGPRPDGLVTLHGDGIKSNCALSNLRYGTPKENNEDSARHGALPMGEGHQWARVTDEIVSIMRALEWRVQPIDLAKAYGVSNSTVRGIQKRLKWRHVQAEIEEDAALLLYRRRVALNVFKVVLPMAVAALDLLERAA